MTKKKFSPEEKKEYAKSAKIVEELAGIKKSAEGGKEKFSEKYSPKEIDEVLKKLNEEELFEKIKEELDKDHLEDNELKMTLFLVAVSSLLKNQKLRMSMQITGKTAEGKDNALKTVVKHLPQNSYMFLTSGTQATLEDDVKDKRLIVISEVNLFKEGGANKNLLEVIKQRTEGGTSALKKDLRTNNKEVRYEKSEQGSVLFGTTDVEQDEELGTRLMKGTIKATPRRIRIVNDNTLETFSDEEKIIAQLSVEDSWIKKGLTLFFENKEQYEIVVPYAKILKEKIDGFSIFDNSDARSQRDIKRLLSLTCATTYLFQKQRKIKEIGGIKFLISEPQDFINTLKYSNKFFNQTYSGMDLRVSDALKFIEEQKDVVKKPIWVDKLLIQDHLKIKHRDTINKYLWELEQKGFIERSKGVHLNEHLGIKTYKGNHIYYRSVQKASNKRLISVQLDKLKNYLKERSVQISVQSDTNITKEGEKQGKEGEKGNISKKKEENEHLKLNTCRGIDFSKSGIKEALENE